MKRRSWISQSAAFAIGFALVSGCNSDGKVPVYPVTGAVTVKSQPAAGVKVILFPQDAAPEGTRIPFPEGTTDDAGKFQLTTYENGDGAPAGNYKVSIVWMETIVPSDDPEAQVEKDKLRGRYSNADQSGLTAVVAEEATELPPFALE